MSLYRSRYLMSGFVLLMLGIQFRMVHSFVLNQPTTERLARLSDSEPKTPSSSVNSFLMRVAPESRKTITPPRWMGLSLITVGAVVVLHGAVIPHVGD